MFLGLRSVIYPAPDLAAAKAAHTALLGVEPYFDQPFYVGFNVGGYELGLDPGADADDGPITYWGVANADEGLAWAVGRGATSRGPVAEVGEGIRMATVYMPDGQLFGIIENPHFAGGA